MDVVLLCYIVIITIIIVYNYAEICVLPFTYENVMGVLQVFPDLASVVGHSLSEERVHKFLEQNSGDPKRSWNAIVHMLQMQNRTIEADYIVQRALQVCNFVCFQKAFVGVKVIIVYYTYVWYLCMHNISMNC